MSAVNSTYSILGLLFIVFCCAAMKVGAAENSTTSAHGFDGPRYRIDALLGWPLRLTCNSSSVRAKPKWLWNQDEPVKRQLWLKNNETSFYIFNGSQLFIPIVRQKYEHKSSYLCMEQDTMAGVAFYITVKDCDPNPCQNGECSKLNVDFGYPRIQCSCHKDYEDDLCQTYAPKSGWLFLAWIVQIIIIGLMFGLSVCVLGKRKKDEMVRKKKENDLRSGYKTFRERTTGLITAAAPPPRRRDVATTGVSLIDGGASTTTAAGVTAVPKNKKETSQPPKMKQVAAADAAPSRKRQNLKRTVGVLATKNKKTLFEIPAKSKQSTPQGLRTRAAGTAA